MFRARRAVGCHCLSVDDGMYRQLTASRFAAMSAEMNISLLIRDIGGNARAGLFHRALSSGFLSPLDHLESRRLPKAAFI